MTTTDIDRIGMCVVRWDAGVSPQARAKLREKIRAVKPIRARRVPTHIKARELNEARGLKAIQGPEGGCGQPWIVRIYYRSMGGEILAFEARGLSTVAAEALYAEHQDLSDALGAQKFREDRPDKAPDLWSGARLVVLPSQRLETATTVADDPAKAPTLALAPNLPIETLPVSAEAPRVPRSLFQAAMARRAARFARAA